MSNINGDYAIINELGQVAQNIGGGNASLSSIDTKMTTNNNLLTAIDSKDFATSTNQTTSNNLLTSINAKDFATAANQTTSNNTLNTISTTLNNVNYVVSNSFSTLGRLYVQNPYEIFASKFDTNTNLDFYDYSYTSTGVSVNANTSTLILASSANLKQFMSKVRMYYEAGKSTELYFTARLYDTVNPNSSTGFGLFDANDGIFIGYNGAINDIQITRRTSTSGSVINNTIPRTSFNLNTLNGFDFTKFQLFHLHILWFGYAYFHFSLVNNGQLIKFHEDYFTNNSTVPYIKSPSLPFMIECNSTAGTQNAYMTCAACNIESGYDLIQKSFNINNGQILRTVTTAETPLLLIRVNATNPKATIRIKAIETLNVATTNNQSLQIQGYILSPDSGTITPTGGTFVSLPNSIAQYNIGVTALTYTGVRKQIYNNYMITSARSNDTIEPLDNEISFTLANGSDYFYLSATVSAGSTTILTNVAIQEIY